MDKKCMFALFGNSWGGSQQPSSNQPTNHEYTKDSFSRLGPIILLLDANNWQTSYVKKNYIHGHMSQPRDEPSSVKTLSTSKISYTTYEMNSDLEHAIPVRKDFKKHHTHRFWGKCDGSSPLGSRPTQLPLRRIRCSSHPKQPPRLRDVTRMHYSKFGTQGGLQDLKTYRNNFSLSNFWSNIT